MAKTGVTLPLSFENRRDAGPIGGVRPIKLSNFGERLFSRKRISDSAKLLKFFAPLSRKKVEAPSVGLARKQVLYIVAINGKIV